MSDEIEDETHAWEYWHQRAHKIEVENWRLRTALRRIVSLDEKNVSKYAQEIASEALALSPHYQQDATE